MATLRAFQLAQELGIENKEFVSLMSAIGMPIKSHMSAIPEADIEKIKTKIAEFKRGRTVEKRVGGTVIRRRVSAAEPAAAEPEASAPSEPEGGVLEPAEPLPEPLAAAPAPEIGPEPAPGAPGPLELEELGKRRGDREDAKPKKKGLKPAARKAREVIDVLPEEVPTLARRGLPWRPGAPAGPGSGAQSFTPQRSSYRKRTVIKKESRKTEITTPRASKRNLRIEGQIAVGELAKRMGIKAADVIRKLMGLGVMANLNAVIDADSAALVAHEFGYEVENVAVAVESLIETGAQVDRPEDVMPRPPVVTVMGHVDHGKTSLLDAIRQTNVTAGEAGGITQHIGAYHVTTPRGEIVFLDTPGHEAFTAMRARGAKATDIVVLVVAADDGVMPQTIEAIDHAKAAGVPIIVATNKMDKPGADPDRVRNRLMEYGLVPESFGGETIYAPVSAKTKTGIEELLESILLQAEVLELRANPKKLAKGVVVEARLEKGRGPVATVLIQEGTLRLGDAIVTGPFYGRVRAMSDDRGNRLEAVTPGLPAEVLGLSGVPMAGEPLNAVKDERVAKEVAERLAANIRQGQVAAPAKQSLEELFAQIQKGETKELRIVLKADTQGSVEAVRDALGKLSGADVQVRVIHGGVGGISDNDVNLASASNAVAIGFNVRPDGRAQALAEQQKVEIDLYSVIYDAVNDVRRAMEGLLKPTLKEHVTAHAEVRNIFTIKGIGTIAGCMITDGTIARATQVRLLRDSVPVYTGKIQTLRRFKDDVKEVQSGLECGIKLENYNDVKVGDLIETFHVEELATRLQSSAPAP